MAQSKTQTRQEYLDYHKQYYKDHPPDKERSRLESARFYARHRETLRMKAKDRMRKCRILVGHVPKTEEQKRKAVIAVQKFYWKNQEKIKANVRQYYANNKNKRLEYSKKYHWDHPKTEEQKARHLVASRRYYARNRDKLLDYQRERRYPSAISGCAKMLGELRAATKDLGH